MERTVRMECGIILRMGMILTAWLFWAAVITQIGHAVLRFPLLSMDNRGTELLTSTDYRYNERFARTLNRYSQFGSMYQEEYSTAVPGLAYTSFGNSGSSQMVPQGICIAGEYMLVTAYDSSKTQNSVIYVLSNQDASNRQLLTTLILPDQNHVGGITFDGENIWIAKSTSGYLSVLSYELLENAAGAGVESLEIEEYANNLYCGVTASFVSYYDDRLWVGTYRSKFSGTGTLQSYRILQEGTDLSLQWESVVALPAYAQGIAFLEKGDETYMLLTTSCGRYSDSQVYLYQLYTAQEGPMLIELTKFRFPPMAEELISDGEYTYVLFESAATTYSTNYRQCTYPVDRISALSNQELLPDL